MLEKVGTVLIELFFFIRLSGYVLFAPSYICVVADLFPSQSGLGVQRSH